MFLGAVSHKSQAQTLTLGIQVGGVGGLPQKSGKDASGIGWGGNLNLNSLGWAAFNADFFTVSSDAGTTFALSPGFAFYPVNVDGFLFGGLLGIGFYKVPGASASFGVNYGLLGDFLVTKRFSIGMAARQHILTNSGAADSLWSVMMSVGYKFEGGGDW